MLNHPDRLFPVEVRSRELARSLYDSIKNLPLICPHGHCDPRWFAQNEAFANPAELFVIPDHYVFRMLVSQGLTMAELGVPSDDGSPVETDPTKIWQRFAENYHLFRGTPSMMWLDHCFEFLFELDTPLSPDTAEHYYQVISARIAEDDFRPRSLFDRFNIEALSTTDCALDDLQWHKAIREDSWNGRVLPTYRPDKVVDPENQHFAQNIAKLGKLTG
ncbi:MAG: glucuronate isomerase, partial [Gammaproteobacteria bacterium]|nr:glucuronate isomerase [Gammaproteobacteria bacterium]